MPLRGMEIEKDSHCTVLARKSVDSLGLFIASPRPMYKVGTDAKELATIGSAHAHNYETETHSVDS